MRFVRLNNLEYTKNVYVRYAETYTKVEQFVHNQITFVSCNLRF